MKNRPNRRTVVRIVTFSLALALTLGALAWSNYVEKERYRWKLEANYQHYFSELAESMQGVSTALQKGQYSASKSMLAGIAEEISREAASAKSAMSGLPFSYIELSKMAKFLSQVGDYVYYLSKKDAVGIAITDEELNNMEDLAATAYSLSMSIGELYDAVADGSLSVSYALDCESDTESQISGIAAALNEIETQFPEYAGLIYDGPFSEHITFREARFLEEMEEVTVDQAKAVAAKAGDFDPSQLIMVGEASGNLPTYGFCGERNGATWFFDVTKTGGILLDMYCSAEPNEISISDAECVERAKAWLYKQGLDGLVENYYYRQEGVVTVNFSYTESNVVCYPDLIKVSVSAEDGVIIGMEARGYVMNHHVRKIPQPEVSVEDAQANLRIGLEVESTRLAIIPTAGEHEVFCHEFLCHDRSGNRALIYVNAETGTEEQILILLESDAGTLTI